MTITEIQIRANNYINQAVFKNELPRTTVENVCKDLILAENKIAELKLIINKMKNKNNCSTKCRHKKKCKNCNDWKILEN